MNGYAIYKKEWLKLRRYSGALIVLALAVGVYFAIDLVGQYANIEPESMMWYRFSHLGDKPYSWLMVCFVLNGGVVAALQYVPEVNGKRVRILTHLPISLDAVVFHHLIAGIMLLVVSNLVLALVVCIAMSHYYPFDILVVTIKDMLFGQFPAIAIYLGLAAVVIESRWSIKAIKLVSALLVTFLLFKPQYQISDSVWLIVLGWLCLPVKDSFLSIKTRRLDTIFYRFGIPLVVAVTLSLTGVRLYEQYAPHKSKYYVFYSDLLSDFVYQENGPHHTFFYGTTQDALSKAEFETALPFVYWKNLDIQGKLPVEVDGQKFDKRQIRNSRMSLQYTPARLKTPEVSLYPLFNPISSLGAIRFPESAVALKSDRFEVFAAETAKTDNELTTDLNKLAKGAGIEFPVQSAWGKTTNMKPFDWGYFIKDSEGQLFNLRRQDDVSSINKVAVPTSVEDIVYVQVSENRHKQFYGYAIDAGSNVYLIGFPNYDFIPLELEGFDYQTMSFQLLSDPLSYLVRYDDEEHYHAVRFSKSFDKLGRVMFD